MRQLDSSEPSSSGVGTQNRLHVATDDVGVRLTQRIVTAESAGYADLAASARVSDLPETYAVEGPVRAPAAVARDLLAGRRERVCQTYGDWPDRLAASDPADDLGAFIEAQRMPSGTARTGRSRGWM